MPKVFDLGYFLDYLVGHGVTSASGKVFILGLLVGVPIGMLLKWMGDEMRDW